MGSDINDGRPVGPKKAESVEGATARREASQPEFRIWRVLLGVVVGVALLIALVSVLSRIRKESVVRIDRLSESPSEQENRVKCASNLRQIGQGIMLYANKDGGKLPPRLEALITDVGLNAEVFVCPSSDDEAATGPTTQVVLAGFAKKGRCSYVYLGAGMANQVKADVVVAYESMDHHEKAGMNVLFGDGHVEWVEKVEAERIIKELEAGRNPPNLKP